jgi:cobalt/nickel transport system permease protein
MNLRLDALSYTNQLRKLPPEHKLIFALTLLLLSFISHPLEQILIAVWMGVWTVGYAKIPFWIYSRLLSVAILFWLSSIPAFVINSVSLSEILQVKSDAIAGCSILSHYVYLSHQGSIQTGLILARSLASISCLYFVLLTVPFAEILQVLRRIGCPTILTELLLLMYRCIFILLETATQLWTAQQARGGDRTWRTTLRSLSLLVGQLLKQTIRRYYQLSLGLESRGFTGEFQVWNSRPYRSSQRYIMEAIVGCGILGVLSFKF